MRREMAASGPLAMFRPRRMAIGRRPLSLLRPTIMYRLPRPSTVAPQLASATRRHLARVARAVRLLADRTLSALEHEQIAAAVPSPPGPDRRCEDLLDALALLSGEERCVVARQLSDLWFAFLSRFGDLDGFIAAPDAERRAYSAQLSEFVRRFEVLRGTSRAHLLLGPRLMHAYTDLLGRNEVTAVGRRLGTEVAAMIGEARRTRTTGKAA